MSKQPIIVAYGVGRDSTALIVEMQRRGIRPDAILFANIGSEKRETYEFIPVFSQWLTSHGFPRITVVRYEPKERALPDAGGQYDPERHPARRDVRQGVLHDEIQSRAARAMDQDVGTGKSGLGRRSPRWSA